MPRIISLCWRTWRVPARLLEPANSESPTQLPPAPAGQSLDTASLLPADPESALPAAVSMSRPAVAGVSPAQRSFLRLCSQSPAIFIEATRTESSGLHCSYATMHSLWNQPFSGPIELLVVSTKLKKVTMLLWYLSRRNNSKLIHFDTIRKWTFFTSFSMLPSLINSVHPHAFHSPLSKPEVRI